MGPVPFLDQWQFRRYTMAAIPIIVAAILEIVLMRKCLEYFRVWTILYGFEKKNIGSQFYDD